MRGITLLLRDIEIALETVAKLETSKSGLYHTTSELEKLSKVDKEVTHRVKALLLELHDFLGELQKLSRLL